VRERAILLLPPLPHRAHDRALRFSFSSVSFWREGILRHQWPFFFFSSGITAVPPASLFFPASLHSFCGEKGPLIPRRGEPFPFPPLTASLRLSKVPWVGDCKHGPPLFFRQDSVKLDTFLYIDVPFFPSLPRPSNCLEGPLTWISSCFRKSSFFFEVVVENP